MLFIKTIQYFSFLGVWDVRGRLRNLYMVLHNLTINTHTHTHTHTHTQNVGFLGGATGKEPACQGRRCKVPSLDWEDPLEKEMTTNSSILASRIPWS